MSFACRVTPSGTSTDHLPSDWTVVFSCWPSGNVTVIVAPGMPVPVMVRSLSVTDIMTGLSL